MIENSRNGVTMVLGLGNLLLGDEGFGVHVVRRLREVELPGNVRVVEGGVGGFNLLGYLDGVKRLLVVDVMIMDSPPGKLHLLRKKPGEPGKQILSFHQVGVLEVLKMRELLGHKPEVILLVTRPEKMEWSLELSPQLQSTVDEASELIQRLCMDFSGTE
ncbi:hydrogenase maturation protease [Chloroflexota bacterium]